MLRAAVILISALSLSACVTNAPSDVVFPAAASSGAPAPVQAALPPSEPAAQTAPASNRQLPAGRAIRAPAAPTEASDGGPLTIVKVREQCWMKAEEDKTVRNDLDKKGAFVEKCVAEQTK